MTATIEATTEQAAMSLKEAENIIADWQDRLQAAQAQLATHGEQIGQLALAGGVDAVVEAEVRLRTELRMAEAGLQAAHTQRDQVRRAKQAERAKQLRIEAAELDAKLNEDAAFLDEWGPKVANVRARLEGGMQRHSRLITQADEIERKLKAAEANDAPAPGAVRFNPTMMQGVTQWTTSNSPEEVKSER